MIDADLRDELLLPASKLTQEVGRMIGSPKTDISELDDLIQCCDHMASVLRTVRNLQFERYEPE